VCPFYPYKALLIVFVGITSSSFSSLVADVVPELLALWPGFGQFLLLAHYHSLPCGRVFSGALHMQEIPELGFS
jgi:hypothetical protein